MKNIVLCEGVLAYRNAELYTFMDDNLKGHYPHHPSNNSGVTIGRGFDFKERDSAETQYILETHLKLPSSHVQLLLETIGQSGSLAKQSVQNLIVKEVILTTEQVFALLHISWASAKEQACFGHGASEDKKGRFEPIYAHLYPPLLEVLNSICHSSPYPSAEIKDLINKNKNFQNLPANSNECIEQCKSMRDIMLHIHSEIDDSERYIERAIYSDILYRTLETGTSIEWRPLADIHLKDPQNPTLTDADKQKSWEPWHNYNSTGAYQISLKNFNLILTDKQNKTLEFASGISVYKEKVLKSSNKLDTMDSINYGHLEINSQSNLLRRLQVLSISRKLNEILKTNTPLDLSPASTLWNRPPFEERWNLYQQNNFKNYQTTYPDDLTMKYLFAKDGYRGYAFLANINGKNIQQIIDNQLVTEYAYTPSKFQYVYLVSDDLNYLRELNTYTNKKGSIKGSVGYRCDNHPIDVAVIKILLSRHTKNNADGTKLKFWNITPDRFTTEGSFEEAIVMAQNLLTTRIKEFQLQNGLKITGFITPDSEDLKKLNGG